MKTRGMYSKNENTRDVSKKMKTHRRSTWNQKIDGKYHQNKITGESTEKYKVQVQITSKKQNT